MLLLAPERIVKITPEKTKASRKASITRVEEKELTLTLESPLKLYPGEEVALEIPQEEDALYIIKGRVLKAPGEKELTLGELSEPTRIQRRKSQRIPSKLKVKYSFSLDKKYQNNYKKGICLNVSRQGVLLATREKLPLEYELILLLEVSLKGQEIYSIKVRGKLIREELNLPRITGKFKYGYGVELIDPFPLLDN